MESEYNLLVPITFGIISAMALVLMLGFRSKGIDYPHLRKRCRALFLRFFLLFVIFAALTKITI